MTSRVRLRVAPGAKQTQLVGRHGDAWKVRVNAPPERGKANDQVCELIAELVGVRARDVRVVSGASSRDKVIEVDGIELTVLEGMLEAKTGM